MRVAQVVDNKVVNIAIASSDQELLSEWVLSDVAQIGWDYVDGEFVQPVQQPEEQL